MKKILFAFCAVICSFAYSQTLSFTDPKFKTLILSSNSNNEIAKNATGNYIAVDTNGDGEVQVSEAQQVKILTIKLSVFNSNSVPDNINDATKFTNVEELYIYHANSIILDYTNNNKIRKTKYVPTGDVYPSVISYSFNNCLSLQNLNDVITSPINSFFPINAETLTVKNCSGVNINQNIEGRLKDLYIENCPIVNLGIIMGNDFRKLHVPNNNSLEKINFSTVIFPYYTYLETELVANNCENLQEITTAGDSSNNSMVFISSININGCSNLKKLKGINYQNINLSGAGLINLEELDCAFYNRYGYTASSMGNVVTGNVNTLNLAGLPKLKKLIAFNQPLNSANINVCPLLQEINIVTSCQYLSNLDVSNLTALHTLLAFDGASNDYTLPQNLQNINAQNCTALMTLEIWGNNDLKSLNLQNCSSLQSLNLGINLSASTYYNFNELNTLSLLQCTSLEELEMIETKVNTLDISDCTQLKSLKLKDLEFLSQVDISNNVALEDLAIKNLPLLSNINSSNNVNLKTAVINECPQITQVDFSSNSYLESLSVADMINLTSVNIRNGSIEQSIMFYGTMYNPTPSINPNLSVCVDDGQLTQLSTTYPDINFSNNCNNLITTIWNGTNWSNGIPTASVNAIINAPYSTASNPAFTAKNVIVNNGGVLEITSGNTINALDMTLKNGGNLIQRDGSTLNYTGSFRVKKFGTSEIDKYAFWSSPVVAQNLNTIYPDVVPAFITEYNTATDYFVTATSNNSAFAKGYSIKTPAAYTTLTFTGVPNNGSQTYTLATGGNGFNLVGNPYPSNLNLNTFYTANAAKISNTFYFWDNTSNSVTTQSGSSTTNIGYATYNALSQTWVQAPNVSDVPTGNVANIGQGFFVKSTSATDTSLNFTNDMRVATTGSFFNKNNSSTEGKFWLKLNSSYNTSNTFAVAYINTASDAYDNYDSKAIGTGSDAFYTTADAQKIVIQGKAGFDINDVVPVGSKHFQNGNFVISMVQKEGIFDSAQAIYLHDKNLGTYTNLQNQPYSFTANAGEFGDRFEIVYKLDVLSTSEVQKDSFEVYREGEDFYVRNSKNIDTVEIFDASKRKIQQLKANSKLVRVKLEAKGLYILKAVSEGKEYTKKIIK
ncbi:T9SS type A sorting domain-containing protein [Chryseobacterium sp. PBS4-4]|uniref:T9SS type A sorting domain-containing protein n=1 Tax=Chryseobacterium edaphi TaxID=2976532 RepID=A0ABT2W1A8_9FLAO|nr:T9SS type A sorting domain-containing protein [Chryseobacterium edaphi]MCU7615795.1 T9SS type A sorting domain-containing protein [Chryseobacterium edaphi]